MDPREVPGEKLVWTALEYEEKERSRDWFWALGVIVITSSIAAAIFGDYFFSLLILIAGLLLGFFAVKKPDLVSYELNVRGVKIRNRFYPFENIKSFWVQTSGSRTHITGLEARPTLFIKSERVFMPTIAIPINDDSAEDIHGFMLSHNIPEEEMREHVSEKIMERLGF